MADGGTIVAAAAAGATASPPPSLPPSPSFPSPFTLLVAGLDGDSTRAPFGGVLSLVPHAERLTRLSAECAFCGEEAHFSVRLFSSSSSPSGSGGGGGTGAARVPSPTLGHDDEGDEGDGGGQVKVGGAESYAPACRRHYLMHSGSSSGSSKGSDSGKRREGVASGTV